jgi:hypothetical protein
MKIAPNETKSRLSGYFALFFNLIFLFGCRSADEQIQVFVVNMPKDFFEILPDSTSVFSGKLSVENVLNPVNLSVFEQKKVDFQHKFDELTAIRPEKLSPQNRQIQLFFIEKLQKQTDGEADFSMFDPLPSLYFFWKNEQKTVVERRVDFQKLLKKIPPFYEAAKLIFAQKKGKNAKIARRKSVETWRFLAAREKEFPKNEDLERAILAVKDWIGFCGSF